MEQAVHAVGDFDGRPVERPFLGGSSVEYVHAKGATTITFETESKPAKKLIITNIETHPDEARNEGEGAKALQTFITSAKGLGFYTIWAKKVKKKAISFWTNNGFTRKDEPNTDNYYVYVGSL